MRYLLIALCLGLILCATVQADATWQWGGMAGLSCWLPAWDHDLPGFDSSSSGMYGPTAFVHYGPVGFGAQYYRGTFDITFDGLDTNIEADRTDLDLILSYRFARYFQASLLYKQIEFDWTQQFRVDTSVDGFGVGGGFTRIFRPLNILLYGYGFYLPDMDHSQSLETGETVSYDSKGYWMEAGTGYLIAPAHLIIKAGYRFQKIDACSGSRDWSEETSGFRIDLNYYF